MMNDNFEIIEPSSMNISQKIFDERITDWIEDGMILNHQMQKHREKYRKKICNTCSDTERKIRGCVIVDDDLDKRDCSHMDKAIYRKFNKKNIIHLNSHPLKIRSINPHIDVNFNAKIDS